MSALSVLGGKSVSWMVVAEEFASVCVSVVCFSSPWYSEEEEESDDDGGWSEAGVLVVGSRRSGGKDGGMRRGRSVRVRVRELPA